MIVHRADMRDTLGRILSKLAGQEGSQEDMAVPYSEPVE
jgi:hypothetical protein